MIRMTFQHMASAEANVYKYEGGNRWWANVKLYDTQENAITFETDDYGTKVEAIMAAFDLVDTARAAVKKLADDEGMRDLEDSVEEATLVANGTEALPEIGGAGKWDNEKGFVSEPDGPVADSVDGYRVSPDEVLDDHDRDCDCPDCIERRDERPLCEACAGSGEGMHDGQICTYCHGRGVLPSVNEEAEAEERIERALDARRDT